MAANRRILSRAAIRAARPRRRPLSAIKNFVKGFKRGLRARRVSQSELKAARQKGNRLAFYLSIPTGIIVTLVTGNPFFGIMMIAIGYGIRRGWL